MRQRDALVATLRARGELWEPAPGLLGLRGRPLAVLRRIEGRIAALCETETEDEWAVPAALPLSTLQRAGYFASFPHWLTVASHLTEDQAILEGVASSPDAARAAADAVVSATTALPPAVCYHVYAALTGSTVPASCIVTAQGCCWRHERHRLAPLERGWSFTMREIVCIGTEAECLAFRDRGITLARWLATGLGLDSSVEPAEDPFFAPTSRGRALLQRVKGLKQELCLPIGDGDTVAAASFNLHEQFFGEAFDIRLASGEPAYTACVAFGLERWLLAALVHEQAALTANRDSRVRQEVA
jgi:seryl-tRNA synthetase